MVQEHVRPGVSAVSRNRSGSCFLAWLEGARPARPASHEGDRNMVCEEFGELGKGRSMYRLIATCLAVAAVAAAGASTRVAAQENGAVRGTVTLEENGDPVHGAVILVVGSGAFALTDEQGLFEVDDVPAGLYAVLAQREHLTAVRQVVTVDAGAAATLDFVLRLSPIHEDVTVTASVSGTETTFEAFNAVSTLDSFDIALASAGSLGDALQSEPGIASRSFGPGSSRPVIRGFDGDRVLILEDGLRTGDLSSQSGDHGVTIDPNGAERIEIVRGPATLLYGSNAVGGLVNVITPHESYRESLFDGTRVQFGTNVGSGNAEAGTIASLQHAQGNLLVWGGGSMRRTDDYDTPAGTIENSATKLMNTRAGLGWFGDRFFASGGFTAEDGRYGVPFANEFHGHHDAHGDDHDAEEDEAHDEDGDDHEEEIEIDIESHRPRRALRHGPAQPEQQRDRRRARRAERHRLEPRRAGGRRGYRERRHAVHEPNLHPAGRRRSAADGPFLGQVRGLDPAPRLRGGRRRGAGPADRPDFLCRVRVRRGPPSDASGYSSAAASNRTTTGPRSAAGGTATTRTTTITATTTTRKRTTTARRTRSTAWRRPIPRDRQFLGASTSIGLRADVGADSAFVANLTHSHRAPALEELYNFGPHVGNLAFEVGNPELDAETTLGLDVSFRHQTDRVPQQPERLRLLHRQLHLRRPNR